MDYVQLKTVLREKGITGAGGGGFPTHAKLCGGIDTLIVNGTECEPLIHVDKYLLERFPREILTALDTMVEAIGAGKGIVALKRTYTQSVSSLESRIGDFDKLSITLLEDVYPSGDEIVLTYDVTGRITPQGCLPMSVGVAVFNVETMLNIYYAVFENKPVTHKWLTVNGMVNRPSTMRVPIGISVNRVIESAASLQTGDCAVIMGGAMTGCLTALDAPILKTTKAILALPHYSPPVILRKRTLKAEKKNAFSVCSQCRMCTDLCPRALLGHDTAPHLLMRMVAAGHTLPAKPYINTFYCSGCGLCQLYACHQMLSPGKLSLVFKNALKTGGISPEPVEKTYRPHSFRNERRVPDRRLIARLGLAEYAEKPVSIINAGSFDEITLPLGLANGTYLKPVVSMGEAVREGQMVAAPSGEDINVPIHASISGIVVDIKENRIQIRGDGRG